MEPETIDTLHDWEGDAEALAEIAAQWSRRLGIDDAPELTVRLVRDYAQRGLIERPWRHGKFALYRWEHLVQLLAARRLLADGWPLQKIAEVFLVSSFAEIRALLPGAVPDGPAEFFEDPALADLRRMRRRAGAPAGDPPAPRDGALLGRMRQGSLADRTLRDALAMLGLPPRPVRSRMVTRIEIAPGIELAIDTALLRRLGAREADAIARAVSACLTDPNLRASGDLSDD